MSSEVYREARLSTFYAVVARVENNNYLCATLNDSVV